jgi:FKBP-type peptidyl-prolyl cis-trans isomerase FkpA
MKSFKAYWPIYLLGVALVVLLALQIIMDVRDSSNNLSDQDPQDVAESLDVKNAQEVEPVVDADSLQVTDSVVGTGAEAVSGKTVTVHYTGKFTDGTVFDSSVGKQPFSFILGAGQVISGWDTGVAGMKVGGKRSLVIPPALGYGMNDYGPIPGGSTLLFDVELLGVK